MRFVLVRHAQSENNRLWAEAAPGADVPDAVDPDPGLTALGRRQSAALAREANRLPWRPTHLYASLMLRAVATAHPLAEALDLPVVAHELLHEVGGPYTLREGVRAPHPGSGRDALSALSPRLSLPDAAGADGWFPGPHEGVDEAAWRARRAVADLRSRHAADDVVLLVSHGWFIQQLLRALVPSAPADVWFTMHNTGVSAVADADPGLPLGVEVFCLNSTGHLPPTWITG